MKEKEVESNILTYPDPILRATAETIVNIDDRVRDLANQMQETMFAAPGIGLAANQIGVPERLIVFDRTPGEDSRDPCILINPEIILKEGEIKYEEACLSVLDFSAEVVRNARVKVRGVDINGKPMDIEADGILAVCLQHEIDHLNGVLYIDHISSLKRALYKKKLKKRLRAKN